MLRCVMCLEGPDLQDGEVCPPEGWTHRLGQGYRCPKCSAPYKGLPAAEGHDPVNHPSHYTSHPSGVECIEITQHMTFCLGNAVKYLWRLGLKDAAPAPEDLKKARWYIKQELKRLGAWEEGEE